MMNKCLTVQNAMALYEEAKVEKDGNPSFVSGAKQRLSSHASLSSASHTS
jgi:hypothetical protein